MWANSRGYRQIEHISTDSMVVSLCTSIGFRGSPLRYAKFEMTSEILIHKMASKTQYLLVQCRLFGESPRPLTTGQLIELLEVMLGDLYQITDVDISEATLDIDSLISESLFGPSSSATDRASAHIDRRASGRRARQAAIR